MFRLAVKNLAANGFRLALTALAIVLGVSFVVSSFVLRDGLKNSFASLTDDVTQGTDLVVSTFDENSDAPLNDTDLAKINDLAGVRVAEGGLFGFENSVQPIKADGTTIATNGIPQLAVAWTNDNILNPAAMKSGRPPSGDSEWVIDVDSAEEHGFLVGETYQFVTPIGNRSAALVGTFRFGENNTTLGTTLMAFDVETARQFFTVPDGEWHDISISVDGTVPVAELQETVAVTLGNKTGSTQRNDGDGLGASGPDGGGITDRVSVRNQADVAAETSAQFDAGVNLFGSVLLGFALVSLFVSVFIISNTFSIVIGQRTRELGLLRAIGSTPSQIFRSVVIESFLVGLAASIIGIGAGVGLAFGLRRVLSALGVPIPTFDVILSPTTVLTAFIVGTGVTVVSSVWPAIAASRTSPIAVITGSVSSTKDTRRRYFVGGAISTAGAGSLAVALFVFGGTTATLAGLGGGAMLLFVGLTLLSPLAAKPLSLALGVPLEKTLGKPGQLAKENAARNPRRTATTAAALMIGLSLVSMALVLGASIKKEISETFEAGLNADYFVNTTAYDVPDEAVKRIAEDSNFDAVTAVRLWEAELENTPVDSDLAVGQISSSGVAALDFAVADELFNVGLTGGSLEAIGSDSVGIAESLSEKFGLGLGDSVRMRLSNGEVANLEVVAIFTEDTLLAPLLITVDRYEQLTDQPTADYAAAKKADGVTAVDADARFNEIGQDYPNLQFQSVAEARETFAGFIDTFTTLLSAMLGLAILIALVGIANTMALSVFERTREIGLLRAVGMTRRQSRQMIRWEAAIISAVGALLGATIGIGLGVALVAAIPDEILSTFSIPWMRVTILVLIAGTAGLVSALLPAFRASRLDVLDAISAN